MPSLIYATDSIKRGHLSVGELEILKSLYPQHGVELPTNHGDSPQNGLEGSLAHRKLGDGDEMFQRSNSAYERAISLEPNRVMAASSLITNRVERGQLGRAYDAATNLVRRRHQSADAHFAMAYVLRYAGILDQSAQECYTARQLDPDNFNFRSLRLVIP